MTEVDLDREVAPPTAAVATLAEAERLLPPPWPPTAGDPVPFFPRPDVVVEVVVVVDWAKGLR